jgi:HEPN domain-containing protein
LAKWAVKKTEEYFESVHTNTEAGRLFPAAEEIFRAVEVSLEALLYHFGVRKIEYPGTEKKFTGRLALQFFIRDNLVRAGRLKRDDYDKYLTLASGLHLASYQPNKIFLVEDLKEDIRFAEELLTRVKSITGR